MSMQRHNQADRLPVIIPSYKGREYVDGALSALPEEYFRPIVAVNGEDDGTVDRALELGAEAFMAHEQGKMPAIQEALRKLGEEALRPLAIMDVDTRIIRPRAWLLEAHRTLDRFADRPLYMTAPLVFSHRNALEAVARTAWYHRKIMRSKQDHNPADGAAPVDAHYGPNTLLHIANEDTLDDMLALDNYWPGEDRAMADVALSHDGVFHQSRSLRMLARTPLSESYDSIVESGLRKVKRKLGKGISVDAVASRVEEKYTQRGPVGSRPYPHPDADNAELSK